MKTKQTEETNKVPSNKKCLSVQYIYCCYWIILLCGAFLSTLLFIYDIKSIDGIPKILSYAPSIVWNTALIIIFFDTVNICYLKLTNSYKVLAQNLSKTFYRRDFYVMCHLSAILCIINFALTLFDCTLLLGYLIAIIVGWTITGIIQLIRSWHLTK